MIRWFRIQVKTEIISMIEELNLGRTALRYIYEVYPYFIHQSVLSAPSDSNNANVLIDDAVKAYNYMYTGLNRDILDFEIDLNNAAIRMSTLVDDGQRNPTALGTVGSTVVATNNSVYSRTVTGGGAADSGQAANNSNAFQGFVDDASLAIAELRNIVGVFGGAGIDNNRTRVAHLFKQAIEDAVTLASLNLTILGDPYFLSDNDMGNYVAPALNPFIDQNLSADYARSKVYVLVKFNSAVDYKENTLSPDPADMFTGIYSVNTVESTFENGQFKQVLQMSRLSFISGSSISRLKSIVDSFFATLGAVSNLAGVLGANGVSSTINGFIQEALPISNSLLGLAQAGANFRGAIQSGDFSNIGSALNSLDSFFASASALEVQYRSFTKTLTLPKGLITPATIAKPKIDPGR
jgi:predicted transcriptional regulator with HTH domain